MSSFTAAAWQPAGTSDEGLPLYTIHGAEGAGFDFHIGFEGSTLYVHVPEGFLTDGPSIPRVVRWLVPHRARQAALKAASVHDLLREDPRFTTMTADAIFLTAMEAEGTPAFWREVFFQAVRLNRSKVRRNPLGLVLSDTPQPDTPK